MQTQTDQMQVTSIPLNDIFADDDFNCRGKITPIDVVELAKDIEKQGLIQPVIVAPLTDDRRLETGCKYRLIAGYRRHTAHKVLKRDTIDCIIRTDMIDEQKARIMNLSENLQRTNLTISQEAQAIKRLKDLGIGELEVGKLLGKTRGWVQIRFLLLKLPENIQKEVEAGHITQAQIRELYSISISDGGQQALNDAVKIIKEGKAKGQKLSVNPHRAKKDNKAVRNRTEIFDMIDRMCDTPRVGAGLHTKALAWAAGEISNEELDQAITVYRS